MRHRLGLATRTQISVCKSPFPSAGTAEGNQLINSVNDTVIEPTTPHQVLVTDA